MAQHVHHHGHHQSDLPTPPASVTPTPVDTTTITPAPVDAAAAADFAQLGATFNDATRALVGGLWQNAVAEGGQGNGSVFRYVNDLQSMQTGLQADVTAGDFTGATLTHVQTILGDLTTAISAATASVNGGGAFGSVSAAETALHNSHLDVLNIVNNDPTLTALATQNGATGFMAAPPTLQGVTAANAPHANLADIGAIFNDAANRILGGVNADNSKIITNDVNAVIADMQQLMHDNPHLFGGLTGIHADTVVRQMQLELTYIKEAGVNPDAGRASNDNILDIIDIVQGDTNLANMANQGGVSGFSPFPDALNPTPKYMDNADQTNFWANFIAQSNSLGQQANQVVGSHDAAAIHTLISQVQAFEKSVTNFDASQGGIFEARFDNELLGKSSTLGAEVAGLVTGLKTGNAALVNAAAQEMHANAADVGGNNVPSTGGTYNADGVTVADVLSTAVTAVASANVTPVPAAAAPAAPAASGGAATQTAANIASASPAGASAADNHPVITADASHHVDHWVM
jgi:hypothetical protein